MKLLMLLSVAAMHYIVFFLLSLYHFQQTSITKIACLRQKEKVYAKNHICYIVLYINEDTINFIILCFYNSYQSSN